MRFSILAVLTVVLVACGQPRDEVIPSDIASWDKELAPHMKKLEEADRLKLTGYLMRAKMGEVFGGKGIPPGTTIGLAIADQTKWETEQAAKRAEEAALKAKMEKERAAVMEQLLKATTVTLLSKRERPKNYDAGRYSETQEIRIGVLNNTEKTLIGVSGEIKFIDVFGAEVGAVSFGISEKIKPKQSYTWVGSRDYNQFIKEHRAVWNLEEGKYTTQFVPEKLVYEDGTKLSAPD